MWRKGEEGRGGGEEGRMREREAGWHECLCGSLNVHKHSLVHVLCGDHVVVQCLQCVCVYAHACVFVANYVHVHMP